MTERPGIHALLIGIDLYLPNELPDGSYESLRGSVTDVGDVERFLKDDLAVPGERIRRLTASRTDQPEPPEPPALGTYHLVDALRRLGPGTTYQRLHDRVLAKRDGKAKGHPGGCPFFDRGTRTGIGEMPNAGATSLLPP